MTEHMEPLLDPINLGVVAGKVLLAVKPNALDNLKSFVKRKHSVLVVGSTGVGKSQLRKSLTELLPPSISYLDRTAFSSKEKVKIGSELFEVWDTPGQQMSSADRTQALRKLSTKPFGVINVVAAGYHEYRADLPSVFSKDGNVRSKFLSHHRKIEVASLKSLVPHLAGNSNLTFFLTVINKADLWWRQRAAVYQHYEYGDYADALEPLTASGGLAVLEYASVFQPFYGRLPGDGTFSDDDRRRARENLLASLISAFARPR